MLEKLGGREVLQKAIDIFYQKQLEDDRLMAFFHGVDVEIIKWHQFNLMSIAFTAVPDNFDLKHLLLTRHQRLYDEGLSEEHFDMVLQHFKDTLKEMNVEPELAKEALEVVMPLRDVFEQGAREARERKKANTLKRQVTLAVIVTLLAAGVVKMIRDKKK